MQFELDNVLLDQILFYMENQDGDFILDTKEKKIADTLKKTNDKSIDYNDTNRFIDIPVWIPNDGYRLMGKFSSSLKNPVIRLELGRALNRNKGVFRAFRDVLEQYPEVEKMWFKYKEDEMKKNIFLWYNSLREEWGLEPVGAEPEDTTSLVLEDFNVKEISTDAKINGEENITTFIAENTDGEIAGTIKGFVKDSLLHIDTIEVKTEYRSLGIGKTLLSKILEKADRLKLDIIIDLPIESEYFSRSLYLENFKPFVQSFIRKAQV